MRSHFQRVGLSSRFESMGQGQIAEETLGVVEPTAPAMSLLLLLLAPDRKELVVSI